MARIFSIQTNFTGGEISPLLRGRVDIAKYANSTRTLENFLITPHGAARRVSGTSYVDTIQDETKESVLLPFEASDNTDYLLEFGETEIRILYNDGTVLWDRLIPSESVGWTTANTGTASSSMASGVITLTGTDASNIAGIRTRVDNPTVSELTLRCDTTGADIDYKIGTTPTGSELGSGTLIAGIGHSISWTSSDNDSMVYIQFYSEGSATIEDLEWEIDIPYLINHPYAQDEISELKYAQFNDVMYIVHRNHKPKRLVRRSVTQWQFHDYDSSVTVQPGDPAVEFIEGAYLDYNTGDVTLTPSAKTGTITLTASENLFASTDVGRYVRWRQGPKSSTGEVTYTGTGSQKFFDIPFSPRTADAIEVFIINTDGQHLVGHYPAQWDVVNQQVEWKATIPTTSQKLLIRRKNSGDGVYGFVRITGYTSPTEVTAEVIRELNGTDASEEWALGAWSDTTGYPRAVTFFQQRLWMGGTKGAPQKLWGSQIGNFYDFSGDTVDNDGSVDSVSALSLEIASNRISTVEWLAGREQLIVGTASSAFALTPTGQSGITASSPPLVEKVSEVGCYKAQGITTDSSTLFINRQQNKVYELIYSFEADSLITAELTLLAEHLSEHPFKKIIRMETPDNIMWVLREDGTLVCLTYMPDQKIAGWSRIVMGGTDAVVKDIITLRGGYENLLYMIVERTINGQTHRYIEKLQPYFRYKDKKEAWFVQSGLHLDNSQNTSLTLAATSGSSVTAGAGDTIFSAGDVGRYIQNNEGNGYAEIIGYIDPDTVTIKIYQTFEDTNLESGTWSLSVTTVSGLDHLEGEEIRVLVDGANHPPVTVSSGSITLNTPCFYIIAGLGYSSILETNYIEGGGQYGSVQGSIARTHEVAVRFFETIGGKIGYSSAKMDDINFRNSSDAMDEGPNLFTGDKVILLPTDYQIGAKVTYVQNDPLPSTIVSLVLKVNIADN